MAFADAFVECMQNAGVQVGTDSVTDQDHFTAAVEYIQSWFNDLDQVTQEALDAATTDDRTSYLLGEANVAPDLGALMDDFDAATGWPLSTLLQWCGHCANQAAQAA